LEKALSITTIPSRKKTIQICLAELNKIRAVINELRRTKQKFIRDLLSAGQHCLPDLTGAFPQTPFPLDENLAKEIEVACRVLLQFIAGQSALTARAPRAGSRNGLRAGLIRQPAGLIELQRSLGLQERCAARHPPGHFADGNRL